MKDGHPTLFAEGPEGSLLPLVPVKDVCASVNQSSIFFMFQFLADATPRPKHVSAMEGVWRTSRMLQLEVERDESDASQGFGGEASGQAVASGVVPQETQLK